MRIIPRSEWGALPPESVTPWNPSSLKGVTIHHFGSPRSAPTAAGSDDLMRSVQRSHQQGEFNDIAYNFCFDKWGQIFEGRGWNAQSGANGTTESNRWYMSFCYMGNSDLDGFPEAAQDACAWLLKQAFSKGVDRVVVPHRKWTGSACPGNAAHSWVVNGGWKADLPQAQRFRWELWDDGGMVTKSTEFSVGDGLERLNIFLDRVDEEIVRRTVAESNAGAVQIRRRVMS